MFNLKICRLTRVADDKRVGLSSHIRSFSTNRNFVTINVPFLASDSFYSAFDFRIWCSPILRTLWKKFPAALFQVKICFLCLHRTVVNYRVVVSNSFVIEDSVHVVEIKFHFNSKLSTQHDTRKDTRFVDKDIVMSRILAIRPNRSICKKYISTKKITLRL